MFRAGIISCTVPLSKYARNKFLYLHIRRANERSHRKGRSTPDYIFADASGSLSNRPTIASFIQTLSFSLALSTARGYSPLNAFVAGAQRPVGYSRPADFRRNGFALSGETNYRVTRLNRVREKMQRNSTLFSSATVKAGERSHECLPPSLRSGN